MLEARSLTLLPTLVSGDKRPTSSHHSPLTTHQSRRYIIDSSNGRPVGFVTRQTSGRCTRLIPWIRAGARYEVHETEDESLLCSYLQSWLPGRGWRVLDADDQLIGWLKPAGSCHLSVVSRIDRRSSIFDLRPESRRPKIEGREWKMTKYQTGPTTDNQQLTTEVGSVAWNESGVVVRFLPILDSDPLSKMLLLVAVLVTFSSPGKF